MSSDVTSELDLQRVQTLNEIIRGRRSVRSFEPGRRVDRAVLEEIAEAGRWAPSGANSQPWEIWMRSIVGARSATRLISLVSTDLIREPWN